MDVLWLSADVSKPALILCRYVVWRGSVYVVIYGQGGFWFTIQGGARWSNASSQIARALYRPAVQYWIAIASYLDCIRPVAAEVVVGIASFWPDIIITARGRVTSEAWSLCIVAII